MRFETVFDKTMFEKENPKTLDEKAYREFCYIYIEQIKKYINIEINDLDDKVYFSADLLFFKKEELKKKREEEQKEQKDKIENEKDKRKTNEPKGNLIKDKDKNGEKYVGFR